MQTIGTDQAFPIPGSENNYAADGLTKREHFAALALQGLLACPEGEEGDVGLFTDLHGFDGHAQNYSRVAVRYADALIAALNE